MRRAILLCSLLSAPMSGFGDARPERPAAAPARGSPIHHGDMRMREICPAAVPGTTISAADTQSGIAVTFTTSDPAQVPELRRRVQAMARMHERHEVRGTEEPERGERARRMRMCGIPANLKVEEVEDGARVVVEPKDPENLDDLRTHVQMMLKRERRMAATGECPMMQMMDGAEAPQEDEEDTSR